MDCDLPYISLLYFLRDETIINNILEYNGKDQDPINTIKSAMNDWSIKRGVSFATFGGFDSIIENAPADLSQDYGQMLLEEGMLLHPEKTFTCLISKKNYILTRNHPR